MLKKIVCTITIIWCLLGCVLSEAVFAAKQSVGPPYPEVWGYDLSHFPAMKYGAALVSAYSMDDGDIWFLISYSYKIKPSMHFVEELVDKEYRVIKFFKKEELILSQKELTNFYKTIEKHAGEPLNSYDVQHTFSDKSKLKFDYIPGHPKRFSPDFYQRFFVKTDPDGSQNRYSILAAYPQVEICLDGGFGEFESLPFLYQKLHLLGNAIYLKDDTFIVFENGSNLILRFNKDFQTKFQPITPIRIQGDYIPRNFFVINYSLIEELEKKYSQKSASLYQNIHDDLLCRFYQEYSE